MKPITKVTNIFDRLLNILAVMAVVLLVFLMLSISYEVVVRYFLGSSTYGLLEIWEYALLYVTFLAVAWLLKGEGHVSVDVVLKLLKPRVQVILNIITSSISAIACLGLAWYGALVVWESAQAGTRIIEGELYPPEFLIVMIIPIGSFLLFIQFLRRTYGYFRS
ncbi:TRAP transporter small permease [Chloroflexota bacterium]